MVDNVLRRLAHTHELLRRLVRWLMWPSASNFRLARYLLPCRWLSHVLIMVGMVDNLL